MTLIEFVKLDHSSDNPLHAERVPAARIGVGLGMAQASVNVPGDGEKVTPDLKLVVMEETMKVLEDVQLGYEKLTLVKCTNTYRPLIQKF